MARSRNASSTSDGSRASSPVRARSAPTTSRNSRSDGSRSSAVQPLGGLEDGRAGGVAAVVGDELLPERRETLCLHDDVEVAAGVQLQVDVAERLDRRAELRARAAHPLRDGPHATVPLR
jgi:hypothetical protein